MPDRPDAVPHAIRAFVYTFLALFIVCALFWVEAWPLTGWRMFSYSRERIQYGWAAFAADANDAETPVPFRRFGMPYAEHVQILQEFPKMSPEQRAAVCDVYIERARDLGIDAERLRIYRTITDLGTRAGKRSSPAQRSLAYTCGG